MLTGFGATEADVAASLREIDYPEDPIQWTDDHREALARDVRARTKPIILVANKADIAPPENIERLKGTGKPVIPATAEGELALRQAERAGVIDYDPGDEDFEIIGDLSDEQAAGLEQIREVMAERGGTGVQAAMNEAVYGLLDQITAYPVQNESKWTDAKGNVLPDAFLLRRGSTPTDLAYAVHSDIGDGYLHAVNAKTDREISDDYELAEGDVVKIVSTAK
jgi:ribosome-binding ATPase YchF (GTP1/OBG family)